MIENLRKELGGFIDGDFTTMPAEKFVHNDELDKASLHRDQAEKALALCRQIAVMQHSIEGWTAPERFDGVILAARKIVNRRY